MRLALRLFPPSNNMKDGYTTIRVRKSDLSRLNEHGIERFGTDTVANDVLLNVVLDSMEL